MNRSRVGVAGFASGKERLDVPAVSQVGPSSPNAPLIFKPPSANGLTVGLSITYTLRRSSGEGARGLDSEGSVVPEERIFVALHRFEPLVFAI